MMIFNNGFSLKITFFTLLTIAIEDGTDMRSTETIIEDKSMKLINKNMDKFAEF
jgi:hypothetical protein